MIKVFLNFARFQGHSALLFNRSKREIMSTSSTKHISGIGVMLRYFFSLWMHTLECMDFIDHIGSTHLPNVVENNSFNKISMQSNIKEGDRERMKNHIATVIHSNSCGNFDCDHTLLCGLLLIKFFCDKCISIHLIFGNNNINLFYCKLNEAQRKGHKEIIFNSPLVVKFGMHRTLRMEQKCMKTITQINTFC